MKMRNYLILIVVFLLYTCKNDSALEKEITSIAIDFKVERFDKAFANTSPGTLPKLKSEYPFLFSKHIPDSIWYQRLKDTLQQQMFSEVDRAFTDIRGTKQNIKSLFQHLKYYDQRFSLPRVITIANNVDYKAKNVVNDSLVIIDLMNYLGQNHEFYQNKALFISQNMRPSQIVPDIANSYAERYAYQSSRKSFLDEMIYAGKLLYFKDVMLPQFSDAEKIGYTQNEIEWAKINESQIWSYFVERELLFSTETELFSRFITPAPFSKFYLELDNESPGRLGQYIGWQIVRAYAERTENDIIKIMQTETEEIFTKSKYKPKK